MTEPKELATIEGWKLTQYEYDGAPIDADKGNTSLSLDDDAVTVDHEERGYYGARVHLRIPIAVLRAIIDQKETPEIGRADV